MSQSITFRCPGCQAKIKAPLALLGRWRTCPGCQTKMVVRPDKARLPADSDPVLVDDFLRPRDRPHSPSPGRTIRW